MGVGQGGKERFSVLRGEGMGPQMPGGGQRLKSGLGLHITRPGQPPFASPRSRPVPTPATEMGAVPSGPSS